MKSCLRAASWAMHRPSVPEIDMHVWIGLPRLPIPSQELLACLVRRLAAVCTAALWTRKSRQCREGLSYVPLGGRGRPGDEGDKKREPSQQNDEEQLHGA